MDIHEPKPWQSVRAFLREYAIIVVGVLTALGAGQVVEQIHENRLSAEARESVRAEINLDLANLTQRTVRELPCIDRHLAEIDALLRKADGGLPFQALGYIGRPTVAVAYTQRWEAATAGARTSLLSINEQRDFARVYAQLTRTEQQGIDLQKAWAHLTALEGLAHPTPDAVTRAREALGEARSAGYALRTGLLQAKAFASQIGVRGDAAVAMPNRGVTSVCLPAGTSRDQAVAMNKDQLGVGIP